MRLRATISDHPAAGLVDEPAAATRHLLMDELTIWQTAAQVREVYGDREGVEVALRLAALRLSVGDRAGHDDWTGIADAMELMAVAEARNR